MHTAVPLRLEVVGFACSLIALWGAVAWTLYQAREHAIDTAAGVRQSLARSLAEYQDASVRSIDLSLRILRDEWARDPAAFDAAVARHEQHLRQEKVIQVAVIDRNANLLYSRLRGAVPTSFADRDYFKVQSARGTDELHVSEPVLGRITRQWAIQFTRPVRKGGQFSGLIVMAVPPPALEALFHDVGLGQDATITLVRSDGQILARTGDLGRVASFSLADVTGVRPGSPPTGDYRAQARIDGVDRFYSYQMLRSYPLTLFVGQSAAAVFAPYYRQRAIVLAAGTLVTLTLGALLMLSFSRARERRRFLEAQERLALDLHDSSIQSIYAVGLHLDKARRHIEDDPRSASRLIAQAEANLNLVIQDLRALIAGEASAPLGERAFIERLGRSIPAPAPGGPTFALELDPEAVRALTGDHALHVLHISREALSNVVRHAHAKSARLSLALSGGNIRLEVSDDGAGLGEQARGGPGLGLHHIEARARKLGGRASVASSAGGTRVAVEFPRA